MSIGGSVEHGNGSLGCRGCQLGVWRLLSTWRPYWLGGSDLEYKVTLFLTPCGIDVKGRLQQGGLRELWDQRVSVPSLEVVTQWCKEEEAQCNHGEGRRWLEEAPWAWGC